MYILVYNSVSPFAVRLPDALIPPAAITPRRAQTHPIHFPTDIAASLYGLSALSLCVRPLVPAVLQWCLLYTSGPEFWTF